MDMLYRCFLEIIKMQQKLMKVFDISIKIKYKCVYIKLYSGKNNFIFIFINLLYKDVFQ